MCRLISKRQDRLRQNPTKLQHLQAPGTQMNTHIPKNTSPKMAFMSFHYYNTDLQYLRFVCTLFQKQQLQRDSV